MNILIIGSEGFIGSNCIEFFSRQHQIYCVDVKEKKANNYFKVDIKNTNFEFVFQNHKFDVCINASGSANVSFSFDNPDIDFELNVLNVHKILVAIRKYNPTCKLINFSSAAVYGNPKQLPISENFACKPVSPYGFHKLQSEYLLKEYHKFFGLHTCSLRVFSAYGTGLKKQLFWDLHQKSKESMHIELFGTGEETRDFIFIEDLLQVVNLVIQKADFEGEPINIASGVESKIKDVAQTFYNLIKPEIEINFSGKIRTGDPNNWQADIEQLRRFGFQNHYSIEQGLKKYIEWLKIENV